MIETKLGLTESITSFRNGVGRMSMGQEEDFSEFTTSMSCCVVMLRKLLIEACLAGTLGKGGMVEGVLMFALTSETLSTKNDR